MLWHLPTGNGYIMMEEGTCYEYLYKEKARRQRGVSGLDRTVHGAERADLICYTRKHIDVPDFR